MTDATSDLWEFISDSRLSQGLSHEELMEVRKAERDREWTHRTNSESMKHASKAGKPWADEDNKIVGMSYMTMKERARVLGRTYHSVRNQYYKLSREGLL